MQRRHNHDTAAGTYKSLKIISLEIIPLEIDCLEIIVTSLHE